MGADLGAPRPDQGSRPVGRLMAGMESQERHPNSIRENVKTCSSLCKHGGLALLPAQADLPDRQTHRVEPNNDRLKADRSRHGWRQESQHLVQLLAPDSDRKGPPIMIPGNGAPGAGAWSKEGHDYSTSPSIRNRVHGNHLEICLGPEVSEK